MEGPPALLFTPSSPSGSANDSHAPPLSDELSSLIAYKASEAVARALLDLELPGLTHATNLLRSVAAQQEAESERDSERDLCRSDDAAYSPMAVDGMALDSYTPMRSPKKLSLLDSGGLPAAAPSGALSDAPSGAQSAAPATPNAAGSSHGARSLRHDAYSSEQVEAIDWTAVGEEVRETVNRVYEQILATAAWLDEAEAEDQVAEAAADASLNAAVQAEESGAMALAAAPAPAPAAMAPAPAAMAPVAAAAPANAAVPAGSFAQPRSLATAGMDWVVQHAPLYRAATRWALENAVLTGVRSRQQAALRTWFAASQPRSSSQLVPPPHAKRKSSAVAASPAKRPNGQRTSPKQPPKGLLEARAVPGLPTMAAVWRWIRGGNTAVPSAARPAPAPALEPAAPPAPPAQLADCAALPRSPAVTSTRARVFQPPPPVPSACLALGLAPAHGGGTRVVAQCYVDYANP